MQQTKQELQLALLRAHKELLQEKINFARAQSALWQAKLRMPPVSHATARQIVRSPMKKRTNKEIFCSFPYFSLLIPPLPVMYLFAQNADKLLLSDLTAPLFLIFVISALVLSISLSLCHDETMAGLITVVLILPMVVLGSLHDFVYARIPIRTLYFLATVVLLCFAAALILGARPPKKRQVLSFILCTGAVILLIMNITRIAIVHVGAQTMTTTQSDVISHHPVTLPEDPPNIVYLIFDEMTSLKNMNQYYGLDLSDFARSLEDKGYQIAHDAQTLLPNTEKMMSAYMNPDFYDDHPLQENGWFRYLNNEIVWQFNRLGYTSTFLDMGSAILGEPYANLPSTYGQRIQVYEGEVWESFGKLLRKTSVLSVTDELPGNISAVPQTVDTYLDALRAQEESFVNVLQANGPTFVHAHVLLPHNPILFDANGLLPPEKMILDSVEDFWKGYAGQYLYSTEKILDYVAAIESVSENTLVVIQGDHGFKYAGYAPQNEPEMAEDIALGIFYAIKLPDGDNTLIADDFSPLDTWRLVLNRYFGSDYEMAAVK